MSSGKQCNSSYLTTLRSPDSKFSCCFMRFWIFKELYTCSNDVIAYFHFEAVSGTGLVISYCTMGQFGDASPSFIGWQISGSKLVPQNCLLVISVGRVPVGWPGGRALNPTGPTLMVFEWLRRKCYLCNDIYKWLDFLLFSVKDEKL